MAAITTTTATTATSPRAKGSTTIVTDYDRDHPLQIIYDTLSSLTDIPAMCDRPLNSAALRHVMTMMAEVQLPHLGIPGSAVSRLRYGISMKVAERENMFDMAAFVLPRGFPLLLHDHPHMTVVSKLLLGEVQIRSFSKRNGTRRGGVRDGDDGNGNGNGDGAAESQGSNADEGIECELSACTTKTAADAPWFLTPDEDNFHEITPITDCVLLDILLPPYDDHDRNCTFYDAQEGASDSWRLVPRSFDELHSRQLFPIPVQYKGYRPRRS